MKVEAYLRAQVPGITIDREVLEMSALSPLMAKGATLHSISLDADVEDLISDTDGASALKYALSTLYYTVSEGKYGGSRTEKMGDVSVSVSGAELSVTDRERYKAKADALRDETKTRRERELARGGMFDATALRKR